MGPSEGGAQPTVPQRPAVWTVAAAHYHDRRSTGVGGGQYETGCPQHRENRENDPKKTLSGITGNLEI